MVSIIFHLTDYDPTHGLGSPRNCIKEWIHNAKILGVDKVIMVDKTEFKMGKYYIHKDFDIAYEYTTSLEEYHINNNTNVNEWIFLEKKNYISENVTEVESLETFVHPTNAIYVFGPDFTSIEMENYTGVKWVYIDTKTDSPLYSKSAFSIVLYDRYVKNK